MFCCVNDWGDIESDTCKMPREETRLKDTNVMPRSRCPFSGRCFDQFIYHLPVIRANDKSFTFYVEGDFNSFLRSSRSINGEKMNVLKFFHDCGYRQVFDLKKLLRMPFKSTFAWDFCLRHPPASQPASLCSAFRAIPNELRFSLNSLMFLSPFQDAKLTSI